MKNEFETTRVVLVWTKERGIETMKKRDEVEEKHAMIGCPGTMLAKKYRELVKSETWSWRCDAALGRHAVEVRVGILTPLLKVQFNPNSSSTWRRHNTILEDTFHRHLTRQNQEIKQLSKRNGKNKIDVNSKNSFYFFSFFCLWLWILYFSCSPIMS